MGYAAATELARVVADFEAVDEFSDFNSMFGRMVDDVSAAEKKFKMKEGYSIVFRSGHPQNLGPNAQPTQWSHVTRIMVVAVEPTND